MSPGAEVRDGAVDAGVDCGCRDAVVTPARVVLVR